MASKGIISGNANGLRTSEVCNPFHYVLTLDLCNNALGRGLSVANQETMWRPTRQPLRSERKMSPV
ncbi:MAG: hypothetical protein E5299_01184 [Burkholderia gladioli]|nr:MAG: hypothetical protein E5299_01184 [Burkholderia gladioli]